MFFTYNKKKNAVLIICLILVCSTGLIIFSISSSRVTGSIFSHALWFGTVMGFIITTISNNKSWVGIEEKGLKMCLRGKTYDIPWQRIKRLQFRGAKMPNVFGILILHVGDEQLYVDTFFKDYWTLWKAIKENVEKCSPQTCIDQDIPF